MEIENLVSTDDGARVTVRPIQTGHSSKKRNAALVDVAAGGISPENLLLSVQVRPSTPPKLPPVCELTLLPSLRIPRNHLKLGQAQQLQNAAVSALHSDIGPCTVAGRRR